MADRDDILAQYRRPEPQFGTFKLATGERVPDATPPTVMDSVTGYLQRYNPATWYNVFQAHQAAQQERERARQQGLQYADGGEVPPQDSILAQYGAGYVPPQLEQGDGETLDTQGILNQYSAQNTGGIPGWMRGLAERIKGWTSPPQTAPVNTLTGRERDLETRTQHNVPLLAETVGVHMPAGALETAANWLDWTPRVGPDTLAPLGLAGMMAPGAAAGAVGVFGGRLARTADQRALRRAEEMTAAGASRDDIWNQTGWFQGQDGKWRFEIDDSPSRIERWLTRASDQGVAGIPLSAPTGEAFRHRALLQAYPDLAQTEFRLMRNPHETRGTGSYHSGIGQADPTSQRVYVEGATPETQRRVALHELQHAIQEREGFTPGTSPRRLRDADPADSYRRTAGEVEARNVQTRMDMSPRERRAVPPWQSQDVPDADQILRQYGQGPQMSTDTPATRAYHWSPVAGDISEANRFRPLTHFGSAEQAAERYRQRPADPEHGGTVPVDLLMSNPLRIQDFYKHDPEVIAALIERSGAMGADAGPLTAKVKAAKSPDEAARLIDDYLRERGHDGLIYANRYEDGGDSYIATRPGTVRKALTGETLFADTARSSLPGVVASGAEGAARAEADRILQQYTKGPSEVERPVEAAIRVDGQVFSGPNHGIAYERASEGLGRKITSGAAVDGGGFITNQGRYVTREEAQSLARRADMTPSRGSQFDSESLGTAQSTKGGEADRILSQYSKGPSDLPPPQLTPQDVRTLPGAVLRGMESIEGLEHTLDVMRQRGDAPDKMEWARSVDLSEPIDARVMPDGSILFNDGHHRALASRLTGREANVNLTSDLEPAVFAAYMDRIQRGFQPHEINPERWNLNRGYEIPSVAALTEARRRGLGRDDLPEFYRSVP